MNIAIIGASSSPSRFSYLAQERLTQAGHRVFPINPKGGEILGRNVYHSILDIPEEDRPIDTVLIYLNPARFSEIADEVSKLHPRRVIFNPGTESEAIMENYRSEGIHVVEACTLILLDAGRFETA